MQRLVEAALVNVSRIDGIWKIIVSHFEIMSSCPVLAVRQLTIEALQTIVLEVFAFKKIAMKQKKPVVLKEKKCSGDESPETETPAIFYDGLSSDDPELTAEHDAWADFAWQ
jgi:hypothetical protein